MTSIQYLYEMTESELKCIFTAFKRRTLPLHDKLELCSHLHEENPLYRYSVLCRKRSIILQHNTLVNSLFKSFLDASSALSKENSITMVEFMSIARRLSDWETLLWCISLLENYHKKSECSEYLSLALKCELVAFTSYGDLLEFLEPECAITIMAKFLHHISRYKCKIDTFVACIDIFGDYYGDYDFIDDAPSLLSQILNVAHELHLNLFRLCSDQFHSMWVKYIQISILENLQRYLVLVKYGFEDRRFDRALYFYMVYIVLEDTDNLFGFRRKIFKRRSNKKYRSYQVLYLYVKAYYNDEIYEEELYDEVLRVLWKTIPDPFLTQNQFLSSFQQADKFPEYLNVWKWYLKVVMKNVESEKSPRSLKHLTRCAIRRILTESAQMPFGIYDLELPYSLESYLSLENAFTDQDESESLSESYDSF